MSGPRLIVALDFPAPERAREFVAQCSPGDCRLKVGLELFLAGGPSLVRELVDRGFDVFLDLKFHDIPTTVAHACRRAADLGVWMLNVHALGGSAMLAAAREAVDAAVRRPLLVGVTVLTSHDDTSLATIGFSDTAATMVDRLAKLSHSKALDGVVCSGIEAPALRQAMGSGFILVTPGIRPDGAEQNDQRRTLTPTEGIRAGADFLVVGRPITKAQDPKAAIASINRQIDAAVS